MTAPALRGGGSVPDAGPRPWILAALCVAAVLLAANLPLLTGSAAPKWDGDEFFGPYFTLIADHARAGRLLLWDPWTSGGAPDFADPQLGAFSPVTVLVGAVTGGSEAGFRAYWLLLWLLGPLGVLVLGRHLGAPAWGALVVALGFAFSGFYTGNAEHTPILYAIAFLPFILWRLDVALTRRRLRPAAEAGALWGLSALGGYPALAILNGAFSFLWGVGRCAGADSEEEPGRAPAPGLPFLLLAIALVFAVGALVLSPSYVGFFAEAFGYSDRAGVLARPEAVEANALHPGALATFASPYLAILKLYRNARLWPLTDVSLVSVYVGAPVVLLALLALAARPASRWRWWLAAVGLFMLACALGRELPVRGWLYDVLPPMRYFSYSALFAVYAMLIAVVLGLLATADLQLALAPGSTPIWRRLVGTAAGLAGLAVASYAGVIRGVEKVGASPLLAQVHLALVWGGILAIAAAVTMSRRRTLLPALLTAVAIVDAALTASLTHPIVYDTGRPRRVWDRINADRSARLDLTPNGLRRELRTPPWFGVPLNNKNLPLKLATFKNFTALRNRFHDDFTKRPLLAAMATGEERIWLAREAAAVALTDAAYAAFVRRSEDLATPVLVLHDPSEMARIGPAGEARPRDAADAEAIARLPGAVRVAAQVLRYEPNELHLAVRCPDRGWLLVTDRWAPGWQATVNGRPTPVLGGDFIFRAVAVDAGPNDLRFVYRPTGWPALVILSWSTLLAVAVGRAITWRRRASAIEEG